MVHAHAQDRHENVAALWQDRRTNSSLFIGFLQKEVSETVLKLTGREFHATGLEKVKQRSPNLVHSLDVQCMV